jgi:2-phosphosulfolactate phosphatase
VRLDVILGPQQLTPAEMTGRVVAVIDVLRASTTIAVALANGARAVIPVESSDEAVQRAKSFGREHVRLAGERRMRAVPGFDFGNSPAEFTSQAVRGKTVLLSTTNGTGALLAVQGARDVVVAGYVNFSAALALLRAALRGGTDVSVLCAGRERQFSLEDAACAGRFVRHVRERFPEVELNDAAVAAELLDRRYDSQLDRLFTDAVHGRALAGAGFAPDLALCGAVDSHPVVPLFADRQITKLGPERER